MMRLLDIPDHVASTLASSQRATLCHDTSILPMKVVIRLLDSLPLPQLVDAPNKKLKQNPAISPVELPTSNLMPRTTMPTVMQALASVDASHQSNTATFTVDSDEDTVIASNTQSETAGIDADTIAAVEAKRNLKATKADDAPVPEYLWNHEIVHPDSPHYSIVLAALSRLRNLLLRRWKWNLLREFMTWFRQRHGSAADAPAALRDLSAGRDCIFRAWNSTWWAWTDGSRPFFWRWSPEYQPVIRDGHLLWLRGALPQWRLKQRSEPDPKIWAAIRIKLFLVRARRYVHPGEVRSLTSFFASATLALSTSTSRRNSLSSI